MKLTTHLQMIFAALFGLVLLSLGWLDPATASLMVIGATLGQSGKVNLHDIAKSLDPSGKTATVVELLNQSNEIITDMVWMEGNLPTGHETTVRTGLPTAIWRQLYQGVPASKSQRAKVTDAIGMLETRSEVDVEAVNLNAQNENFRLSEAKAFLEGLNQQFAQTLFYGNTAINPERFMGLAPRYSAISGATNGVNVISAGGAGADNTSIWLIVWSPETICGIYPKGSVAGIQHKDLGEYDAFDSNSQRFRALGDLWKWKCGLTVSDWRYAVRICNVDISDLVGQTGTQASTAATAIIKLMIRAMARIPSMGAGVPVFYANRTVKEMLAIAAMDKSQNAISVESAINQFGQVAPGSVAGQGTGISGGTVRFLGVPVRTCDQLLTNEAVVS